MKRILLLAAALASLPATAEVYRWVDSTGKVNVTDTPPPGNARTISRGAESQPAAEAQSFATQRAAENFPVTLYSAADCTAECRKARDLLSARGVPFNEKMVQKPEDFAELKELVGDAFVPSLKVGKHSYRGFLPDAYNNLLDLAGYPSSTAASARRQAAGGSAP